MLLLSAPVRVLVAPRKIATVVATGTANRQMAPNTRAAASLYGLGNDTTARFTAGCCNTVHQIATAAHGTTSLLPTTLSACTGRGCGTTATVRDAERRVPPSLPPLAPLAP